MEQNSQENGEEDTWRNVKGMAPSELTTGWFEEKEWSSRTLRLEKDFHFVLSSLHLIALGTSLPIRRREVVGQHDRNQLQASRCHTRAKSRRGTLAGPSSLHTLVAEEG